MTNRHTGKTHYHGSKGGLLYETILMPRDSPNWLKDRVQDREGFWSDVYRCETRKDAQFAREIDMSLLHELTLEQNIDVLVSCVQQQFVDKGMVADIAIHEPPKGGDPRNIHAHVLLTMREITPDGFGKKVRAWNHPGLVSEWRAAWCKDANRCLERNGYAPRLNHRSYKERNIEKEPTRYQGPAYRRQKQKSKELDVSNVPKGPIDIWKLLRETIDRKSDGRDSKGLELER